MKYLFELTYETAGAVHTVTDLTPQEDFLLDVVNTSNRHTVRITARRDLTLHDYRERAHDAFAHSKERPDPNDRFFMNGYQSWTDTRECYAHETERDVRRIPRFLTRMFSFDRYGDALSYDYKKENLHGYDLFYSKGSRRCFVASLNEAHAYLIAEVERKTGKLTLISDVKGKRIPAGDTFTLCDYLYDDDYFSGVYTLRQHLGSRPVQKLFGYTSWYNYYQDISESILLRDLDALDQRFNLFQIDDGFETFVGDWLEVDPKKFPHGLAPIVDAIHQKGYMAGLWLAPFAAEKKSRLFREHPDWLRKDAAGEPIKCGSNWSGFYALDLENEDAKAYIRTCLKTYADMGFDFFKLDFLYAANLPRYEGKTSAEVAHAAYAFLRESLGDKLILGCGATLSNACGVFDYCRIGPDVSLKFDDVWYMRKMHRERISTKVTLQNTVYRGFLNGIYFGCDPDVFLLRDDNLSLTKEQRVALLTLNALFGSMMMTSDNIGAYNDIKRALLAGALDLFENAEVSSFERKGAVITVRYTLRDETREIQYHTEKGVLI